MPLTSLGEPLYNVITQRQPYSSAAAAIDDQHCGPERVAAKSCQESLGGKPALGSASSAATQPVYKI